MAAFAFPVYGVNEGRGDADRIDDPWAVTGTRDRAEAKATLLATAPVGLDGLVRKAVNLEQAGPDSWRATVQYGERKKKETGESSFSFDTTGGTFKITHSLETLGVYAAEGVTAPDTQGGIGLKGTEYEGVEIIIPQFKWSETWYLPIGTVTEAYKQTVADLTGTVNQAIFRGRAAGTVLFEGAAGQQRGEDDWEVMFRFVYQPNRTDLMVGDIGPITKPGWAYLWVWYQPAEDVDAKRTIPKPAAVFVERVYYNGDYSLLGL